MKTASIFVLLVSGTLASFSALADPFPAESTAGLRASYTIRFGTSNAAPLQHELALYSADSFSGQQKPALEYRWDRQRSELMLAGLPYSSLALNETGENEEAGGLTLKRAFYITVTGIVLAATTFFLIEDQTSGSNNTGATGATGGTGAGP